LNFLTALQVVSRYESRQKKSLSSFSIKDIGSQKVFRIIKFKNTAPIGTEIAHVSFSQGKQVGSQKEANVGLEGGFHERGGVAEFRCLSYYDHRRTLCIIDVKEEHFLSSD